MSDRTNFLLSKWYFDCVSDSGEVFIGYAASLRWKTFSINYSSSLRKQPGRDAQVNTSLREFTNPRVSATAFEWSSPQLDVSGTWNSTAAPISHILLESDAGSIEWHCLQPCAHANVRTGVEGELAGLGYVEHLTMSIPPWQLPIDELRWGRFLSAGDALVWIVWRGAKQLHLLFHNGVQVESARSVDCGFEAREISLALEKETTLREGPLIKTALSQVPGIQRIFPPRILRAHEHKLLSKGRLKKPGPETSIGWAIHEVVHFSKQDS